MPDHRSTPYYCRNRGASVGVILTAWDRPTALRVFAAMEGVPVTSSYLVVSTRAAKGVFYERPSAS